MADNFTWEESGSGIEFASTDVSGVHYQLVKVAWDDDGTPLETSYDDPLPVILRNASVAVTGGAAGGTPVHYQVAYVASQTAATVYTPASGNKLAVTHITISASGAGTVKLFDGTDSAANAWSPILSLAASGGWDAHFSDDAPLMMSAADNVLKYTSGAGAAGSIWLHGWEE